MSRRSACRNPKVGEIDELITLLVARAPELHAAGITSLKRDAEGFTVTLGPPPPPPPKAAPPPTPPPPRHPDALEDGITFPNGIVPGFTRDKDHY